MTLPKSLMVLLAGRQAGVVERDSKGRLTFTYDETWRSARDAIPLSLSMPLTAGRHEHRRIEPFLWGLLPDNEHILSRWGQRFQVSPRNVFALVAHTGEDLPGAVQLVRPERIHTLDEGRVEWLTDEEVGERLRLLKVDPSAGRIDADEGQFSLAEAQPKTALIHIDGRWGVPSGRIPTTHILKPPTGTFDGHAEKEHFCLSLLREFSVATALTEVRQFDREVAIVVERYDRHPVAGRRRTSDRFVRLHQEDLCQATGISPTLKYQDQGGPGPRQVVELLRSASSKPDEDIATFVDALIFNWLIAGTDAHAKNYSLLIAPGGAVRLAPLYDVASALPYPELNAEKLKLAMKVGDKYRLRHIGPREWDSLARSLSLEPEQVAQRIRDITQRMPTAIRDVKAQVKAAGLRHRLIDTLAEVLTERAESCGRLFG